ncbi:MAG TPA: glycosyl hydrolase 115 family protein [Chryseolinea sp.]|nr:glycosyl hydrolase 115 family protein [Chryseolinea sp.]
MSFLFCLIFVSTVLLGQENYVSKIGGKGFFNLSSSGKSTSMWISATEFPGVVRAAKDLQEDIAKVTGAKPVLLTGKSEGREAVIIGTIGKSELIDELIKNKKINVTSIQGKWETSITQIVEKPMKGVDRALVIVGSDKRGTIYGIYELSKQIGVSPWHWWADVPAKKSTSLFVLPGQHTLGEPAVKYRGIFLNDEEPALGRWAVEKYGGFNHECYETIFELILRMKGNYLWPAMWWASFNTDDPLNQKLADEYGIVMSTTHHEPMMRAHADWKAFKGSAGEWNYDKNQETLKKFWREGIERMGNYESIISMGMRGDGDMAMEEDTNISLLERIVKDQREIITDVTKKPLNQTPQLWALYKEVQDYYDKGMRAPDDVTLLLCDDNWGNNRKLPKLEDPKRSGGYGIYYHFDYVGGPRNYKWLNTNQISRTWEQMHLAYEYGADRIWIVNVGDLKPMEFPIEFFLDYAWNPKRWTVDNLGDYTRMWAEEQFGGEHAAEIANILTKYTTYNARRKHELLSPETYSLINYREAETVTKDYQQLTIEAERIYALMPAEYKDAYYQLVLHPTKASANLYALYFAVAKNRLYATQGRAETNSLAEEARQLFKKDSLLSHYYNTVMANGKWNHMMDQTHISYTYWQQPAKDVLPEVKTITLPVPAEMGVAIEGFVHWETPTSKIGSNDKIEFPLLRYDCFNQQSQYIEIFNRGQTPFDFNIESNSDWVKLSQDKGTIEKQTRVEISIDWAKAPVGKQDASIIIRDANGKSSVVVVAIINPVSPKRDEITGFVENNRYISMEAEHYTKAVNTNSIQWKVIPEIGRTLSGVTTFPVTSNSQTPGGTSPHLEYTFNVFSGGEFNLMVYISPTLNFHNTEGLRYGVSIDDQPVQVINLHADTSPRAWEKMVADNINITASKHTLSTGHHILKFWMIDSGVVLQKIVLASGEVKASYLGPPESFYRKEK